MTFFVIVATDKPDTLAQRMAARPKHLERLQQLHSEQRLLVAGPCPVDGSNDQNLKGFTGSVVIAQFASLQQAEQWADQDPYLDAGVYESVVVKPYKPVLGSAVS